MTRAIAAIFPDSHCAISSGKLSARKQPIFVPAIKARLYLNHDENGQIHGFTLQTMRAIDRAQAR
jgi:hypothetical protein